MCLDRKGLENTRIKCCHWAADGADQQTDSPAHPSSSAPAWRMLARHVGYWLKAGRDTLDRTGSLKGQWD